MQAAELRTSDERALFVVSFIFALITWIVLVVTIIGIVYGIFIGFFLFVAHALMIAHIKGHAVKLSEEQFPQLHKKVIGAAEKLGLTKIPDVYLMQAGGMLNAFATKFTGRNFVVIYSDLLEACDEDGKEIEMIIGHELGHLVLGHLKWFWFLAPSKIIPWLGSAYSRACEYSCDLCGFEVTDNLEAATRGLAILAVGGKYAKQMNMRAFLNQVSDIKGFWTSVYELNASHPFLPKRIAALINRENPGTVQVAGRHVLAYPLAPILGFSSPAGSAPLVMIAMIGVLAAIAIPQFAQYQKKADQAQIDGTLINIQSAAKKYHDQKGAWPCTSDDLKTPKVVALAKQKGWEIEMNCRAKYGAIIFPKDGKKCYKAVFFDTGERKEGTLKD